jgi:hypothetical protein
MAMKNHKFFIKDRWRHGLSGELGLNNEVIIWVNLGDYTSL